ncbi:hypothetical protein HUS23_03725 [Ectothiorhodospiraceae bacterium 2226]|nr:hypothetical protein HUS23_03725 [Ectothiorhodospiraceae bacterium 2226]
MSDKIVPMGEYRTAAHYEDPKLGLEGGTELMQAVVTVAHEGEARQVALVRDGANAELAVDYHAAHVPALHHGDGVIVLVGERQTTVMARLRRPGERPPVSLERHGDQIVLDAREGDVVIRTRAGSVTVGAAGAVRIHGGGIEVSADGELRIVGPVARIK